MIHIILENGDKICANTVDDALNIMEQLYARENHKEAM